MPYWNITGIANVTTDPLTLFQQVNEQLLFGGAGMGICLMIGVIEVISMMMITQDAPKALMVTAWTMFIISLFMWLMQLVPVWWLVLTLLALAMSLIFYQRREY
jgi:Ca2+/Na+ antiporter